MRRVLEDIKNKTFKSCYLFYGEEDYLKESYRDRLIKALFPEEDTMNLNRFGDDVKENQIIDAADAMPFFAEKRMVVAENTGFFSKSTDLLSDYLKSVPETTVILFVEKNVDKRNACYKAVDKTGLAIEFNLPTQADLETWVLGKLKKEGKSITRTGLTEFIDRCGFSMESMDKELEKLICYSLDKEGIDERDVDAVCIPQITANIWKMVDAVAERNPRAAYQGYQKLLLSKENPLNILNLIERHFRLMLSAAELNARGYSQKQISSELGLQDFVVGNYLRQSKAFSRKIIMEMLDKMADVEMAAKTGKLRDFSAVEIIIAEYSSRKVVDEK